MKQTTLYLIVVYMLSFGIVYGQNRKLEGIVTSSVDGSTLSGVTVQVEGSSIATQTDASGRYTIEANSNSTLVFSYMGFLTKRIIIRDQSTINVSLEPGSENLEEVVVTALGVQRTRKSIGYAVQQVKGEDLTMAKQADFNTALAGKIAGVQIRTGSGAKFGSASIRIRGVNNLTGGNPIYIVDGVVTGPEYINNDDIENLTILKGPAATALYGQRGSEGAVVITTKRAKIKDGFGISVNQGTSIENVYGLPAYQNEYGGGYSQEWEVFKYRPGRHPEYLKALDGSKYYFYLADESWGPKMDGTIAAPWFAWDPTHPKFGKLEPFTPQPNNVKNFFETGTNYNTNIAIEKADEKYQTRVSYTNVQRKGVMPNSKQGKNWFSANLGLNLSTKLSINTAFNFVHENRANTPLDGYSSGPQSSFNQWFQRNLNLEDLKNYKRPNGTFRSWNINSPTNLKPAFWNNPYAVVNENLNKNLSRRIFGHFTATYQFNDELKANGIIRANYLNRTIEQRVASNMLELDEFYQFLDNQQELNFVASLEYKKKISDFDISASAYAETRRNRRNYLESKTEGGLSIANLYNITASKDRPTVNQFTSDYKVNSLYAYFTVGYKDFLFLETNARNDWSSSLPIKNNSYLYGGLSGSFVFSEFVNNDWFSFGRIRASIARVGTDTDPYRILQTYSLGRAYGKYSLLTVPNEIPNENLKPTLSTSKEIGAELRFFKDRLTFDYNFYTRSSKDQILPLSISGTSGYSSMLINAGQIDNWGHEVSIGGTPIKNQNFTWFVNANLGTNKNKVVDLYNDPTTGIKVNNLRVRLDNASSEFALQGAPVISVNARVGETYGMLRGSGFKRNEKGEKLIGADGYYMLAPGEVDLGSVIPDFTGGLTNTFKYKGVSLGFSLDFQKGGNYMSVSSMFGHGSGLYEATAGLNAKGNPKRDDVEKGGGVLLDGVLEDGSKNEKYVDVHTLYGTILNSGRIWENWVYDASYIKMREINIGYTFPNHLFNKFPIKNVSFNLTAQNPFLIYAQNRNFDPSILEQSWFEGGQLPNTRMYGFNLKFNL